MTRLACAALLALLLAAAPSDAQDTDVSGRVDGVLKLSIRQAASGDVRATASSTVGGTALSVRRAGGRARTLRTFAEPVTGASATVRTAPSRSGVTRQTVILGPQSP